MYHEVGRQEAEGAVLSSSRLCRISHQPVQDRLASRFSCPGIGVGVNTLDSRNGCGGNGRMASHLLGVWRAYGFGHGE